jgi:hypothetical protein
MIVFYKDCFFMASVAGCLNVLFNFSFWFSAYSDLTLPFCFQCQLQVVEIQNVSDPVLALPLWINR